MLKLNDRTAEPAASQTNLQLRTVQVSLLIFDLLITLDPGLLLGRARLCPAADPGQLAAQKALPLFFTGLLPFLPRRLLLQKGGVVAFVRKRTALVKLKDAAGNMASS